VVEEPASSEQIRMAVPEDAARIAAALRRSFAEYESLYTPAAFAATVPTPEQILRRMGEGPVWVAVENGTVVGTVAAVPRVGGLYVRGMAVDPAARGRGTGRALLERVEEFALANGFGRLLLSTTPFLLSAIRLYEKHGFRRDDAGPHDLLGTLLFTMVKDLSHTA
jgi:GNAT superfamily N-acetyltransferase